MQKTIKLALINFAHAYDSNIAQTISNAYGEATADTNTQFVSMKAYLHKGVQSPTPFNTRWVEKLRHLIKEKALKVVLTEDFIQTLKLLSENNIPTKLLYGNAPEIIPTLYSMAVNADKCPELGVIIKEGGYYSTETPNGREHIFKKACNGFPTASVLAIVGSHKNLEASSNVGCHTIFAPLNRRPHEPIPDFVQENRIRPCDICTNWGDVRTRIMALIM